MSWFFSTLCHLGGLSLAVPIQRLCPAYKFGFNSVSERATRKLDTYLVRVVRHQSRTMDREPFVFWQKCKPTESSLGRELIVLLQLRYMVTKHVNPPTKYFDEAQNNLGKGYKKTRIKSCYGQLAARFIRSGEIIVFHQPQNMIQQHTSALQILPLTLATLSKTDPLRQGLCMFLLDTHQHVLSSTGMLSNWGAPMLLSTFMRFTTSRWHLTVWYEILLLARYALKLLSLVFTLISKEVECCCMGSKTESTYICFLDS